jgi:hypothetical protein
MQQQNYSNHSQYVIGYHFITLGLIALLFIFSIIHLEKVIGDTDWFYTGILPVLGVIALGLLAWYARQFALKAQDRAIRAEEALRYFILTNRTLDSRLTMGQIIALRFAPDDEFRVLISKAVSDNLSPADIKKAIINWKPDEHRA